jgi:hypothetical protein
MGNITREKSSEAEGLRQIEQRGTAADEKVKVDAVVVVGIPIEVVTVDKKERAPQNSVRRDTWARRARWRLGFGAVLRGSARRGGRELGEDDRGETDHHRRIRLQSSEAQVADLKDETHNT